ncbi:MAG: biotin--[acetyl-CoA-carboxylase] ligase, partial [Pyrinomonadaceae bacterium]
FMATRRLDRARLDSQFPKGGSKSNSMDINILRFDSLDSTNTEAAKQAKQGAAEGLCVIAREQTAGRGRHGRTWSSYKNAGLYFSLVLRPTFDLKHLSLITLMAGIAVHDALEEFGLRPDIKWVNDIHVGDKKVSGILAETAETPTGLAVIVGIGVNLTSNNLPDEVAQTSTSIERETGSIITADELAEVLTRYLSYFYDLLSANGGSREIIRLWRDRSSYFSGKHVRVTLETEVIEGVTDGLEDNGALRVRTADGSLHIVQAGDVERLRSISCLDAAPGTAAKL